MRQHDTRSVIYGFKILVLVKGEVRRSSELERTMENAVAGDAVIEPFLLLLLCHEVLADISLLLVLP